MTPTVAVTVLAVPPRPGDGERERERGGGCELLLLVVELHEVALEIVGIQWLSLENSIGNDGREFLQISLETRQCNKDGERE